MEWLLAFVLFKLGLWSHTKAYQPLWFFCEFAPVEAPCMAWCQSCHKLLPVGWQVAQWASTKPVQQNRTEPCMTEHNCIDHNRSRPFFRMDTQVFLPYSVSVKMVATTLSHQTITATGLPVLLSAHPLVQQKCHLKSWALASQGFSLTIANPGVGERTTRTEFETPFCLVNIHLAMCSRTSN